MQALNQKNQHTSTTAKTTTTATRFNYADALKKVTSCGKELYGPKFRIFDEDRATILKLLCWFFRDAAVAEKEGLCLDKGILLTGPPGCGKSAIMKIISTICDPPRKFTIKSSPRIVLEFAAEGYKAIDRYAVRSFCLDQNPRTVCFDDLGGECDMLNYEVHFNSLARILSFRYEMFMEHKMITHITTNLDNAGLEDYYGPGFRRCLSQLFNQVAFPGKSVNKKKL